MQADSDLVVCRFVIQIIGNDGKLHKTGIYTI